MANERETAIMGGLTVPPRSKKRTKQWDTKDKQKVVDATGTGAVHNAGQSFVDREKLLHDI